MNAITSDIRIDATLAQVRQLNHEIREITGLRAFAILAVLFYHLFPDLLPGGYIGVDLFFVISGFVVTNSELRRGAFSGFDFYIRRIRRIYPALLMMIAALYLIYYFTQMPQQFSNLSKQAISVIFYYTNFYFLYTIDYFSPAADQNILLHCWSLAVEEQYYLYFILVFSMFSSNKIRLTIFVLTFIISIVYFSYSIYNADLEIVFYSPFARAWQLMAGSLAAFAYFRHKIELPQNQLSRFLAAIAFLAILFTPLMGNSSYTFINKIVITLATLSIIFFGMNSGFASNILKSKILNHIGNLSYSLYIFHWPILVLGKTYFEINLIFFATYLVATYVFACISYYLIETPVRQSFRDSSPGRLASASMVFNLGLFSAVAGGMVILAKGIPERIPPKVQSSLAAISNVTLPELLRCYGPKGAKYQEVLPEMLGRGDVCTIGTKDQKEPTFALIGDSHAYAISSAFDAAAAKAGQKGFVAFHPSCPTLAGVIHAGSRDHRCDLFFENAMQQIEKKNISTVFLVARWDLYLNGGMPGSLDSKIPPLLNVSGDFSFSKAPYVVFEEALKKTLARLKGRKVIFFMTVPQILTDVRTVAGANLMVGRSIDRFRVDKALIFERKARISEILRKYASDNFIYFDPTEVYCPASESKCLIEKDGKILYLDDDHLNMAGAALLTNDIGKFFSQ